MVCLETSDHRSVKNKMTQTIEQIDTLIVGAGQAGVAMSEHLTKNSVPHVVLERDRIAERWRSGRWDSLVANGPAWHDRFPNKQFDNLDPDAFAGKEAVADYFVDYAKQFNAPIRCGVSVTKIEKVPGRSGYRISTSAGTFEAHRVVVATGPFQQPIIPPIVPNETDVLQIHSHDYKNPAQLPNGAVLVVGSGSSGTQIADELRRAGRKVYLSVGPHDRPPRAYRGRDFVWWLGVLGKWEMQASSAATQHVTISVSGANGGKTIDFKRLANEGITLTGMTAKYEDGALHFADDLATNIANGDANYLSVLDEADAFVAKSGIDLPEDPQARHQEPDPACLTSPIKALNLSESNITSIVWATGFTADYSWMHVNAFDQSGNPQHQRGISSEPGFYFLGLPWLSSRGSSFIWGVWHDAKHIADHIAIQRDYMAHHEAALQKNNSASNS